MLWILFNENGQYVGESNVGSLPYAGGDDFQIFAVFNGINLDNYGSASVQFYKPDLGNTTTVPYQMIKKDSAHAIEYNGLSNGYFTKGTKYQGFYFNFLSYDSDEGDEILDTAGLWRAVITLMSVSSGTFNRKVVGSVNFHVGNGNESEDSTETSVSVLLNNIYQSLGTKLNEDSSEYIKSIETEDINSYDFGAKFNIGDIVLNKSDKITYELFEVEGKLVAKEAKIGSNNLENGSGINAIQMKQDGTSGTFNFTDKNPNATVIDETLTGNIAYGATGNFATVVGGKASAQGKRSMAQGTTTIAKGPYSHAEGDNSVALGGDSHAEGYATVTYGVASHAEGNNTIAGGEISHAEGYNTQALGEGSHAEGAHTIATGDYAHAGGLNTIAGYNGQTVIGHCNDNKETTIFEVGNGWTDENGSVAERRNAFEVYLDGHAEVQKVGETDKSIVNKGYVNEVATNILEVAEGKSDVYVLSCFDNLSTCKESLGAFYVYNYETKEWENKKDKLIEGYFDSYTIINNKFFSEEDYVAEAGIIYLILRSVDNHIVPIDGGYYRTRDYFLLSLDYRDASQTLPKVGDIFLITENGVPDRWYGGGLSPAVFYTLETQKINIEHPIKKHTYEGPIKFDESLNNLGFNSFEEIRNTDIIIWENPNLIDVGDDFTIYEGTYIFRKQSETSSDNLFVFSCLLTGFYTFSPINGDKTVISLTLGTTISKTLEAVAIVSRNNATKIKYSNKDSGLKASRVQSAIDEIAEKIEDIGDTEQIKALQDQITDLKNAIYGSILSVEPQTYENVGVAVMDRANGYPIVDNQKAQVMSIKGRTLNVNQLAIIELRTEDLGGITFTNNGDGTFTLNGTATTDIDKNFEYRYLKLSADKWYYMAGCIGGSSTTYYIRALRLKDYDFGSGVVAQASSNGSSRLNIVIKNGTTINNVVIRPKFIDLTQMFGVGNEPTTIEEFNRLTMGFDFDTYNEGTIVSTNINKIISNPFNIFDGKIEGGNYHNDGGYKISATNNFRSSDYISVVSGKEYTIFTDIDYTNGQVNIYEYDKNKNFLGTQYSYNKPYATFALRDNTCYVNLSYYKSGTGWGTNPPTNAKICFNLTGDGSLDGKYKPYKEPIEVDIEPVEINGIGTAQDEMTETETIIRTAKYTITGEEKFSVHEAISSGLIRYSLSMPSMKKQSGGDGLCDILPTDTGLYNEATIPSIRFGQNNTAIYFYLEQQFATSSEVAQYLKGATIIYPLETPTIEENGFGEILLNVQRGGTIATDSNGDVTLTHVVYKPIQ